MWIRIAVTAGALAVAAVSSAFLPLAEWIVRLVHWMRGAGVEGALVYLAIFVLAAVCMVPGGLLTMGAGMAYGPVWGAALASPASVLGSTLAFILARTWLRSWVTRWAASAPRFRAVDAAVGAHGLRIVTLMRLSPIFPYNVLNYAFGATRIRLRDYVLGSFVGMLPGAVLYAYIGSLVGHVAKTSLSVHDTNAETARHALWALGLGATLIVTVFVTSLARRALAQEIGAAPDADAAS